jgi:hypothetical protein
MKKLLPIFLSLFLSLSMLVGCDGGDTNSSGEDTTSPTSTITTVTTTETTAEKPKTTTTKATKATTTIETTTTTTEPTTTTTITTTAKAPETTLKATEPPKTSPPPPPETKAPETQPPAPVTTKAPQVLKILSFPPDINRGEKLDAVLKVQGKPNTEYDIIVRYPSGTISKAAGLDNKITDENGYCEWNWKVGANTHGGVTKITIEGGGETVTRDFTVIE